MRIVRRAFVITGAIALVVGCASTTTSPSSLRSWAARRLHCPEKEIVFEPVGGDCLGQSFPNGAVVVASGSDCDLAARGCDHYAKFIHAPKGDWYEVR